MKLQKKLDNYDSIPFVKAVKEYNEGLTHYLSDVTLYYNAYEQDIDYIGGYSNICIRTRNSMTRALFALYNVISVGGVEPKIRIALKSISIEEVKHLLEVGKANEERIKEFVDECGKDIEKLKKQGKKVSKNKFERLKNEQIKKRENLFMM